MRTLSAIILAAATTAAQAQDLQRGSTHDTLTLNDGAQVIVPHCTDAGGRQVRYVLNRSGAQQPGQGDWSIVSTFSPAAGPQVQMTPDILTLPQKTVQFVVEHECAHHSSGDIFKAFMESMITGAVQMDSHTMEYAADCAAAHIVRDKYGYGENDLEDAFAAFPPHDRSKTHPPTAERLKRAISCLKSP